MQHAPTHPFWAHYSDPKQHYVEQWDRHGRITHTFTDWSGGVTGTTNPIPITMDTNQVVTAAPAPYRTFWPRVVK